MALHSLGTALPSILVVKKIINELLLKIYFKTRTKILFSVVISSTHNYDELEKAD